MRIGFKTFGCRANSVDTDVLFLEAEKRGHSVVDDSAMADAYIINSCTVTANADKDARFQVSRFKRQNPKALIGVIGCYSQVSKGEVLGISDVDFVVGTAHKNKILDLIENAYQGAAADRDQVESTTGFLAEVFRGSRNARASIKIQDGCNFKCSFCIIPTARGRSRSLPADTVLKQVEQAWALGYQEIILTGIHLAHYGWDLGTSLEELLEKIFAMPEGPRVRLSTLDPFEISDSLIAKLGVEPRLCPHLHIAIQSGSDKVLKAMRRIYKAEEFVAVTEKVKKQCPDTFIGVDVIVGFPGEGEAEFAETVKLLEDTFWTKLHVFSFSERKGTAAAELPDKVHGKIINDRSRILREMSDRRYQQFLATQVGKQKEVVLEKMSEKYEGFWLGHTDNYLPTLSKWKEGAARTRLTATLTSVQSDKMMTSLPG